MKIKKKKPRFLRKDTFKVSKFGRRKKKKQKWRRARGIHNKIRRKEKGYGKEPRIGYGAEKKNKGNIQNLKPLLIKNIADLEKANSKNIIIISRTIGKKKKKEILKKIEEKKLKLKKY
jgi:large subunit ribosomal protein L32e